MSLAPAPHSDRSARWSARTVVARGVVFFALWFVLMQSGKPADLMFGLLAALAASWVSLRLIPPGSGYLRFGDLAAYFPHFIYQSVLAGIDVARRALDPRLPLQPGFVRYETNFPPGLSRNAFTTITSLLPGSAPCGEEDGAIVYHCLDMSQPILEQLALEERALTKALMTGRSHG